MLLRSGADRLLLRIDPGGHEDLVVHRADSPIHVHQDVHSWMSAHVHVFEHPWFATTGTEGTFRIADVPPGTHTLRALHETFGETSATVTVAADATTDVTLHLSSR